MSKQSAACDVWIVNPLSERCAEMGTTIAAHLESTKTAQGKGRWAHCGQVAYL